MKRGLILSYTQLCMLASAQGCAGLTGLPECCPETGAEAIFAQIRGLSEAGLITAAGDSFACTQEGAEIGRRLGSSGAYITVRSRNPRLPDFCCYPGRELMICSPNLTRQDTFSVSFVTVRELFELLLDEGYFPKREESFEPDDEELERYEEISGDTEPNQPIPEDGSIILSAERIDIAKGRTAYVRIISYYFYCYICEKTQGKAERKRLCSEAVEAALKGLMNNGNS